MPKTAGARDIAPKMRSSFFVAIERLKAAGGISDMADIWMEMITQDPFKAFDTIAKFTPKEIEVTEDVTHRLISGELLTVEQWETKHLAAPADKADPIEH